MVRIEECATGSVVTVDDEASIDEAIGLLQQHQVRHLPVLRDGRLVGMVSAGDVLVTVGGLLSDQRISKQDPTVQFAGPTGVKEIMSTGLVTMSPDEPLAAAAQEMLKRQISAVLLLADEELVGIVTESDYLRRFFDDSQLIPDACREQRVADHMAEVMVTATPRENVFKLIRDMGKVHHVPVLDNGQLVGILSDHDVRRTLALDKIGQITEPIQRIRLLENFDAGEIMSRELVVTSPEATLAEAAWLMIERRVGALPVIESGDLAGIITETDILQACIEGLEGG